ncbi:MAG: zinc metalloprotease HtpX [Gammaproteobacteria bacterium]|nr:zinc metalloprotease HtpX [Gammaproteobacteria bacterium]MCW5582912.1 zinc metalloprotease HtpX [Gammaproteobacteria bacterium]
MSDNLNRYAISTADWRATLRRNNFRTRVVITLFFLIYAGIGMLVDMYMVSITYPSAALSQIFHALITLQIFPIATSIMLVIAAVSLLISYTLYDKLMLLGTEYHEVTPATAQNTVEQQLYNVVEEMKIAAGLRYMPRVFIINANYMNAFASGYSEKSAMVAITRGLIEKLNRDELQAVMAHELSHIRHLDIKLTLTASLLANLSIMVLDILFYNAIFSSRRSSEGRSRHSLAMIIIILRYTLPIISLLLLLYLSRTRELMADAGSVELMRTNRPLASALIKISTDYSQNRDQYASDYNRTPHENIRREVYIYDPLEAGIKSFTSINDIFSTHPSLAARLAALGFKKNPT